MSIIRSPRKDRGFTIVSNDTAQDGRLSMRALGLLVRLLSRPDNWETNSEKLAREFDVGREQMQGVLRELSGLGYMSLVKHRNENGTISSKWHVYDDASPPCAASPAPGKPAPENPYAGKPVAIKQDHIYKEPNTNTITPSAKLLAGERIEKFWAEYPRKVGKDAAMKAFLKRKTDDALLGEMIEKLKLQIVENNWTRENQRYIPHPATWLNEGRWMDEVGMASTPMNVLFPGAI